MVLKLQGLVNGDFYDLQIAWDNRRDGSFDDFDGRALFGLQFDRRFGFDRGPAFPLTDLFVFISDQLKEDRYVIVSLDSPGGWHMAVIYDEKDEDFVAITKVGEGNASKTAQVGCVKAGILAMQGTDVLVYENVDA